MFGDGEDHLDELDPNNDELKETSKDDINDSDPTYEDFESSNVLVSLYRNLKLDREKYRFMPGDIITLVVDNTGDWKNTRGLLVDSREQNRYQGISGGKNHRWTTRVPKTKVFGHWKYYITGPISGSDQLFEDFVEFELVEYIWEPLEILDDKIFQTEEDVLNYWENNQENLKLVIKEVMENSIVFEIEQTEHPRAFDLLVPRVESFLDSIQENLTSLEIVLEGKNKLIKYQDEVISHQMELFENFSFDDLQHSIELDMQYKAQLTERRIRFSEAFNYRKTYLGPYSLIFTALDNVEDDGQLVLQNLADELGLSVEHIIILCNLMFENDDIEGHIDEEIYYKPSLVKIIDYQDPMSVEKINVNRAKQFIPENPIHIPTQEIAGLGATYAKRLAEKDVKFTHELVLMSPDDLALQAKTFRKKTDSWIRFGIVILNDTSHPVHQKYLSHTDEKVGNIYPDDPTSIIKGIGKQTAQKLSEAGISSVGNLVDADMDNLANISGIKLARLEIWVNAAKSGLVFDKRAIPRKIESTPVVEEKEISGSSPISIIKGVGKKTYEKFVEGGFRTLSDLTGIDPGEISKRAGIIESKILKWLDQVQLLLDRKTDPIRTKKKAVTKPNAKTHTGKIKKLTEIKGLGPTYEKRLLEQGITTPKGLQNTSIDDLIAYSKANKSKILAWLAQIMDN